MGDGDDAPADEPPGTVPPWWDENAEIRDELGLPGYDAPRFDDGRYVHDVVDAVTGEFGVQIRLVDPNPQSPGPWEVRVDGDPVTTVRRTRDGSANTVFRMTATEFRAAVADAAGGDGAE